MQDQPYYRYSRHDLILAAVSTALTAAMVVGAIFQAYTFAWTLLVTFVVAGTVYLRVAAKARAAVADHEESPPDAGEQAAA